MVDLSLVNINSDYRVDERHTVLTIASDLLIFDEQGILKDKNGVLRSFHGCSAYVMAEVKKFIYVKIPDKYFFTPLKNEKTFRQFIDFINELFPKKLVECFKTKDGHNTFFVIDNTHHKSATYATFCLIRFIQHPYYWAILDFILKYKDATKNKFAIYYLAHHYLNSYFNELAYKYVTPKV